MCIRKVLYCPLCKTYKQIPEATVPAPEGSVVFHTREVPCGFSYCGYHDPLLAFIEPPIIFMRELEAPCNPRCSFMTCRVVPVLSECCGPNPTIAVHRLVSLRLILSGCNLPPPRRPARSLAPARGSLSGSQARPTEGPNPSSRLRQQAPGPSHSERREPLRPFSARSVYGWVCSTCSWEDCRRIRQGGVMVLNKPFCRVTLDNGERGFMRARLLSLEPGNQGSQEFQLSYGWILNGIYWGPEGQEAFKDLIAEFLF